MSNSHTHNSLKKYIAGSCMIFFDKPMLTFDSISSAIISSSPQSLWNRVNGNFVIRHVCMYNIMSTYKNACNLPWCFVIMSDVMSVRNLGILPIYLSLHTNFLAGRKENRWWSDHAYSTHTYNKFFLLCMCYNPWICKQA